MKGDDKLNLNDTIEKCQLGDTEAFKELFTYIEPKAFGTAYLISGKRGLSEDIVQETFVNCMEQIKSLKCPAAFNVWFYRILTRVGWRMVKQYSKIPPKEAQNTCRNDFEEQVQKSMTYSKLRTSVNELSANLKTVIVLYYFNEMSIKEIAKITHTLEATVKTRLFYARTILHKKLEDQVTDFTKGENYNQI